MIASETIRAARASAGLTQAELGRRLGMTQAAIARLEQPSSNPTLRTLDRILRGAGRELQVRAIPASGNVDETLIARQLRMTPAERLAAFERTYEDVRELALAGKRSRGELA